MRASARLAGKLHKGFKATAADVMDQVRGTVQKAEGDDIDPNDLDLSGLDFVLDAVPPITEPIALDGGVSGLASIGMQEVDDLVNVVSEDAVAYARDRAAEMVGKRWVNGKLVENPDAVWRIDEPTRDGIRRIISDGLEDNIGRDAIADMIGDSYWFSEDRAQLIADTEITMANQQGVLNAGKAAEASGVEVTKSWYLDEDPCPICEDNAAEGEIAVDDDFPSGDDTAPAHPNCECTIIFHTKNSSTDEEDDTEE